MLNVDIRKAFDTVCWDFILNILEAQGFPHLFITWIRECISSPRFSVVINEELAEFFAGKRSMPGRLDLSLLVYHGHGGSLKTARA